MPRFAVIEAPSILGLRPTGVERLPEALLQAGLNDRLAARHAGRVVPETAYDVERDTTTLTLNANGIASYSRQLADAVGTLIDRGEVPVVLGGELFDPAGQPARAEATRPLWSVVHRWSRRLLQP